MRFPAEAVPDGMVLAPHHLFAVLGCTLACWVVADDYPHREPVVALCGSVGAAVAFVLVWPLYPVVGALLVLAGLLAALLAPLVGWGDYPLRWRAVAVAGSLAGLDDWISHALGVWTPFDWFWHAYMVGVMA